MFIKNSYLKLLLPIYINAKNVILKRFYPNHTFKNAIQTLIIQTKTFNLLVSNISN